MQDEVERLKPSCSVVSGYNARTSVLMSWSYMAPPQYGNTWPNQGQRNSGVLRVIRHDPFFEIYLSERSNRFLIDYSLLFVFHALDDSSSLLMPLFDTQKHWIVYYLGIGCDSQYVLRWMGCVHFGRELLREAGQRYW